MREPGSHSYAAMRISRRSGILTRQGNRAMTKNLVLAASMTMLMTLSGQALAGQALARTATADERYWPEATAPSHQHFNAFGSATAQTVEPNAHRYHGGPKSND
jgi:hypothetical protein